MTSGDDQRPSYLRAAQAVAAEDEERAGVATYLRVDPGSRSPEPSTVSRRSPPASARCGTS